MATIYLIRHGQASFGLANYDRLSAIGKEQAAYLRGHFGGAGRVLPSEVYAGSMQRQRETAAHGFPEAGIAVLPGLNEFDHADVLRVYRPQLFEGESPAVDASTEDIKKFMRTDFPLAIRQWITNEEEGAYSESFPLFKERCMQAFREMLARAREEGRKEVVAVTSGGFISLVMTQLLQMPDALFPELNLAIANASVTAFLFNDAKVSLAYFNNYSHLPGELLTFR